MKSYKNTLIEYFKVKFRFNNGIRFYEQQLFEFIRLGKCSTKSRYSKKLLHLFCHIFLSLVSLPTILKFLFKNNYDAHYFIDSNNNNGGYDKRSLYIFKYIKPGESINFIHSGNLLYSVRNFYKKENLLYFESLFYIYKIVINIYNRKRFSQRNNLEAFCNKSFYNASEKYSFLLRFIGFFSIRRFIFLDDSRHISELNYACFKLSISCFLYMHARFNRYHVGLSNLIFDKYFVWSDYFRDLLLKINHNAHSKNVFVVGHPSFRGINLKIKEKKNILIIGEANVNYEELKLFFDEIKMNTKVSVIFREKPGCHNSSFFRVNYPEWKICNENKLSSSLRKNLVGILIGTHSTLLIESYLLGLPSLHIKSSYDYSWHLVEEDLLKGCDDYKKINQVIETILSTNDTKEINMVNEQFWGMENNMNLSYELKN